MLLSRRRDDAGPPSQYQGAVVHIERRNLSVVQFRGIAAEECVPAVNTNHSRLAAISQGGVPVQQHSPLVHTLDQWQSCNHGKAIPDLMSRIASNHLVNHHAPMKTTQRSQSEAFAKRLDEYLRENPGMTVKLAKICGVSRQSIYGWRTNGAISKNNLAHLIQLSGRPLEYWLGQEYDQGAVDMATQSPDLVEVIKLWAWLRDADRRHVLESVRGIAERNRDIAEAFSGRAQALGQPPNRPSVAEHLLGSYAVSDEVVKRHIPPAKSTVKTGKKA